MQDSNSSDSQESRCNRKRSICICETWRDDLTYTHKRKILEIQPGIRRFATPLIPRKSCSTFRLTHQGQTWSITLSHNAARAPDPKPAISTLLLFDCLTKVNKIWWNDWPQPDHEL